VSTTPDVLVKVNLVERVSTIIPDVLMFLNVDLVELCVCGFPRNIRFHLHCHVARQHRQQQALLTTKYSHT
jgi:hypothetical protein